MQRNNQQINFLYDTVRVRIEIVPRSDSERAESENCGIIRDRTIESIRQTEYVRDHYLVISAPVMLGAATGNSYHLGSIKCNEYKDYPSILRSALPITRYIDENDFLSSAEFFTGYSDVMTLESSSTLSKPILISKKVLQQCELPVVLWENVVSEQHTLTMNVAGVHSQPDEGGRTIILCSPATFEYFAELFHLTAYYNRAVFEIDSSYNRDRKKVIDLLRSIVEKSGSGKINLRLQVYDNEIREVVEPLEKSLKLLHILHPIALLFGAVAAAALASWTVFASVYDIALMRVLGNSRRSTFFVLFGELLLLTSFGLLSSQIFSAMVGMADRWAGALMYIAGVLGGYSLAGGMTVTRNQISMLQTDE